MKNRISYESLINILRSNNTKLSIFTGAGISVASGIPDFRTPETGVYANVMKYGFSHPQEMFDIGHFRQNPRPFYQFSNENFNKKLHPNINHYFISFLAYKGILEFYLTQNVDGL